jgi:hypothetical protein
MHTKFQAINLLLTAAFIYKRQCTPILLTKNQLHFRITNRRLQTSSLLPSPLAPFRLIIYHHPCWEQSCAWSALLGPHGAMILESRIRILRVDKDSDSCKKAVVLISLRRTLAREHQIAEGIAYTNLADRPVGWGLELSGVRWPVDKESAHLHLTDGIEGDQTDVGFWEGLDAGVHLSQNLLSVLASEHGELPHGPVPVVLVSRRDWSETLGVVGGDVSLSWLSELQAWGPAVSDDVVDLLGDLIVGQRWEEGESLEELVVSWGLQESRKGVRVRRGGLTVGDSRSER